MNRPNQLTVLRILLSFLLIFCLLTPGFKMKIAAIFVFAVASLTDLWDGRLARLSAQITDFGILMDPIADKILVLSAYLSFVQLGVAPAWMVVLIAAREFIVTGIRFFALGKGHVLSAEAAGKYKTVSQIVAVGLILLFLLARELVQTRPQVIPWIEFGRPIIWWVLLLTVIVTLTSGISFFWQHRKIILSV